MEYVVELSTEVTVSADTPEEAAEIARAEFIQNYTGSKSDIYPLDVRRIIFALGGSYGRDYEVSR
jgi:hypothetical protein